MTKVLQDILNVLVAKVEMTRTCHWGKELPFHPNCTDTSQLLE